MKKGILLLAIFLVLFTYQTNAQEKDNVEGKANVEGRLDIFLTFPAHEDLGQKYNLGGGGKLGFAVYLPNIKSYIIPQLGFDFMGRGVGTDDTYRETIFFLNFGVEVMKSIVSSNDYSLLPFIGINYRQVKDRYLVANGTLIINSNGSNLDYDKEPHIFTSSAPAFIIGLENRFGNYSIRLLYDFFAPELTADLEHSYDDIDEEIFDTPTKRLNLSTIKIGVGAYF